jgi:broad specificity phosphatase PhoE
MARRFPVSSLEQRHHGRRDSPLTERGIAEAHAIPSQALVETQMQELIESAALVVGEGFTLDKATLAIKCQRRIPNDGQNAARLAELFLGSLRGHCHLMALTL